MYHVFLLEFRSISWTNAVVQNYVWLIVYYTWNLISQGQDCKIAPIQSKKPLKNSRSYVSLGKLQNLEVLSTSPRRCLGIWRLQVIKKHKFMCFKQEVVQFLVNFDKPLSWATSFSMCFDELTLVNVFFFLKIRLGLLWSIQSTSVHFGPLLSISIHFSLFGPFESTLVYWIPTFV